MTTINAYSVGLSLNADSYIKNSRLSRTETNSLKREITAARTPAERYSNSVNKLDRALAAGAINQRTYNRLLSEQKQRLHGASAATQGLTNRLGGIAAAYISLNGAMRVGSWAFKLAADAEQAQVAFEVLTKDAGTAEALLTRLRSMAASTPFQQAEIIGAGRSLLAFGFAANEVADRLQMMGNISAATGTRIEDLADILGKMRVQGRIMSEDLNQLTGRGINVLDGLAARLKVATSEVKDMASKGRIEFSDLLSVLQDLANNEFGGMMAKQAETAAGKLSTLTDKVDALGRSLGDAGNKTGFLDFISRQVDQFSKGVQFLGDGLSGDSARVQQGRAQIELMESQRLLANIRAGRDTPDVLAIRERGQAQIAKRQEAAAKEQAAKEKAATAAAKEVSSREKIEASTRRQAEYEKRIGDLKGRMVELAAQEQRIREDVAAGPGSGMGDPQSFIAKSVNAAIASQVSTGPAGPQRESASLLRELHRLERQAAIERQKHTELLTTISENKFERIR